MEIKVEHFRVVEERKHRAMAEALGMTWEEYLKLNPHLIQR